MLISEAYFGHLSFIVSLLSLKNDKDEKWLI